MPRRKTPLPFPQSGECLKYYRELRGYTQEQLAEMVGMTSSYYGYIERGRQMATIAFLARFAEVLAVPIEALLDPKYRNGRDGAIKNVLKDQIGELTDEECKIAYELMTKIVPMIRAQQKQHKK